MIGRTLRQYRVTARLGEGGMGVVWKARDTILERDVALKVLPAALVADPARKERFYREARAASGLNHPNIITIYEINAADGVAFIAMEYVAGETLAERLARGPMSIDEIVSVAQQTADAVGRAHAAGIIHRDVKPGNIMITADGLVKVLDFGLARVDETQHTDAHTAALTRLTVTQAGMAMGTPGYMSPEQALGDNVDARSDVFSFGVLLHKMLTNELPFSGETHAALLHKLHFAEPPPIEVVRPDVPAYLAAIARRALAKNPEDRFATLSAAATALRNRETFEVPPTATTTLPTAAPAGRLARRRGQLALLVPLLVLGAWLIQRAPPGQVQEGTTPAEQVVTPFDLTQQAAALLARDDREGNVDRAITQLEAALAQDRNYAPAYAHLSDAYLRRYQNSADAQWLRSARETAQQAVRLNPDLAVSYIALGFVHVRAEEYEQALPAFQRASELDPLSALSQVGRGNALAGLNRDEQAISAFTQAIALGGDDWRTHLALGQLHFDRARFADAVKVWEQARRLTPDNVVVLRNLGAAYFQNGQAEEAASALQRALEVQPAGATYTNLGTVRFFQGRYTDAVAAFEKAVEQGATRYTNWGNLGDGLRWAPGRRVEASVAYRTASRLIAEQLAQRPTDPDLRTRHATFLVKMGERDAALNELAAIPPGTTLSAQMHYRIAIVRELAGDRTGAIESAAAALKAGYKAADLNREPELTTLRSDARYQRLIGQF